MKLLITGGAGYIGSHVASLARESGHDVVVLDDLSTGISDRVPGRMHHIRMESDEGLQQLRQLFQEERIDAVIHLAARKQVGESVAIPEVYYRDNISGLANLLIAMREANVKKLVFSSSAATYGMPDLEQVSEETQCSPINPYGETKLVGEWLVRAAGSWGLAGVNLRYFNVAGSGRPELADRVALNLIPIAIEKINAGLPVTVFGSDYPTDDGSCIRDYVHVSDLARAHLVALEYLEREKRSFDTFNVGTGVGASVFEVLEALKLASGVDFKIEVADRRAGDPPRLVANVSRIYEELGFKSEFDLSDIVSSAWQSSRS